MHTLQSSLVMVALGVSVTYIYCAISGRSIWRVPMGFEGRKIIWYITIFAPGLSAMLLAQYFLFR